MKQKVMQWISLYRVLRNELFAYVCVLIFPQINYEICNTRLLTVSAVLWVFKFLFNSVLCLVCRYGVRTDKKHLQKKKNKEMLYIQARTCWQASWCKSGDRELICFDAVLVDVFFLFYLALLLLLSRFI